MAAGVGREIGGSANLIWKVPRTTGSVAERNRKKIAEPFCCQGLLHNGNSVGGFFKCATGLQNMFVGDAYFA